MRVGARKLCVVVAAVGMLGLAACGGGGNDDAKVKSTTPATAGKSTTTTAPKAFTSSINGKVWWQTFEINVSDVKAEPQAGGGVNLTIDVHWTNLSDQPQSPPQPALERDGEVLSLSSSAGQAAGQAGVDGTLTGYIAPKQGAPAEKPADLVESLRLTWGEAGDNQSIVPLDGSDVTTFEPKEVSGLTGKITTPTVVVAVDKGQLHWSYASGQKGKFVLSSHISITCGAQCPDSGTSMSLTDLTLTAPGSSTAISPSDDDSDFCCEAVYPGTSSDDPNNTVAFLLD
ncbi:MAG: hypothetical protein JO291_06580, partial [Acidimicrobiia bacterium]|nr:hypothetical protein [Acidimicrobiia bacterium]